MTLPGTVVELGLYLTETLGRVHGEVASLGEVLAQEAIGRSYVCQAAALAASGGACGWPGRGLDLAVEPAGEDALERSADVAVGFAQSGALGFVVA